MANPPEKSDGAFRTIREVADWLGVPTHVLRFWESKFDQIAPVKGAGGRRYYRPEDMRLLGGIKVLLHDQGLPIRGVAQKIDEEGVDSVTALSPPTETPESAPKTRRVIRHGEDDDAPRVVPFDRARPDNVPAAAPTDPDLPDDLPAEDDPLPAQPDEMEAAPQPTDDPISEPASDPTQPDAFPLDPAENEEDGAGETDKDGTKRETPAPEEPGPDPGPGPGTGPTSGNVEKTPDAPTLPPPTSVELRVTSENRRQLRRILRKLRGLIEEIEEEISSGAPR